MPKKTLTIRDFTKGLNTDSSPRDIEDNNLARSVGVSIERPGILRPLGKANSLSGDGEYYRFEDGGTAMSTSAVQDPGHGLYAFSFSYNHGERAQITKVLSNVDASSSITFVRLDKDIGTDSGEINVSSGDIIRIYGRTADRELNNRYFEVKSVSAANKTLYLKTVIDGTAKEFSLLDESGNRLASTIYYSGGNLNGSMTASASAGDETTVAISSVDSSYSGIDLFSLGDYVMVNQESMKITAMDASAKTATFKRGELGSTVQAHSSQDKIVIYTYGPTQSGEGGIEQIYAQTNRDFSGSGNWGAYNSATISVNSASAGKLRVTTAGDAAYAGQAQGVQLADTHLKGPNDDKPFQQNRKYRVRAKLTGVANYSDAQIKFILGDRDCLYYPKPVTKHIDQWHDGTITGSEVEYYTDIIPYNTTGNLRIEVTYHSNYQATQFDIDDVSIKEIDSLGEDTSVTDGFLEVVPQRNFTKYIACQSAETIDLYVSDSIDSRASGWYTNIADLNDKFEGNTDKSSIGLDTMGQASETLLTKGIMPTYFFGDKALRISPANKIGIDDTNYSPRWYGHIKRDKIFGADYSVNYMNEWYKDTVSPKKPVISGGDSYKEMFRYQIGITTDYSKKNNQGSPWGHNWFNEYYMNGKDDKQIPAIAVMQDIDCWEDEEDLAEGMSRQVEVENDEENGHKYEISSGQLYRNKYHNFHNRDNAALDNDERWKVRRNVYNRITSKKETIALDDTIPASTNDVELNIKGEADKFVVGKRYLLHDPDDTYIKCILDLKSIGTTTDLELNNWDVGEWTPCIFSPWKEGGLDSNGNSSVDLNDEDEFHEVTSYRLTKPHASGDICTNNGGGGFMGAYTDCDGYSNTYGDDAARLYGGVSWIGLTGYANCNLSNRRKISTLTYNSGENNGAPGKATITAITRSGNVATYTTKTAHGFSDKDRVKVEATPNNDFDWNPLAAGDENTHRISNVTTNTFDIDSTGGDYNGRVFSGDNVSGDPSGNVRLSRRGLPDIINTLDPSMDNTNWIYHNSTEQYTDYYFQSRNVARGLVKEEKWYFVTFSVRNFNQRNNGSIRVTVGQTLTELDTDNTDEYYDIKGNAYKMTVAIKSPETILEVNKHLGVNFEVYGNGDPEILTYEINGKIGSTSVTSSDANHKRTLLGDISLVSRDRFWNSNVAAYSWPKTSIAFGWNWTWGIEGDSWGLNASTYDFYVSYLYDGGGTPQESAPTFLRTRDNVSEGTGLRISASVCYSSVGDVYDMFNRRITGARLYFKATDSLESDKLQALLDIDFIKGVRKSNNASFVPWEEDFSGQWEKEAKDSDGQWNQEFDYVQDIPIGPYKQVKPANQSHHLHGYFRFDSPPSVLDYETLNSSLPFEKGDFFAQYKTAALLKGKCYIANFSILPNGLSTRPEFQSFDYYPNAIVASEEGCYDKFPFESKWINLPIENDDSPIVKLESFNDNLVIHKELSTYILSFKDENNPNLVASLNTSGITWQSQSIATSVGVFWINKYGCFLFDGKQVEDIIDGKISKSDIGWPNNNNDLYYWNIEAGSKRIPSLGYDEVNRQLLISKNCRQGPNNEASSEVWIYDFRSKSWTSDRGGTLYTQEDTFLAPILANTGYRTNFISESGKNVIFIDNRVPNGTSYNFSKWSKELYVERNENDAIIKADKRSLECLTKELDFGNPHQLKRIYQIFVTYRLTSTVIDGSGDGGEVEDPDIDIDVDYGLDGGPPDNDFQQSANNNFENSFSGTDGEWAIATLVPNESIECFTFQLKLTTGGSYASYDFEINDITFVYRTKNVRTRVKE